jgi:hypothetical protein
VVCALAGAHDVSLGLRCVRFLISASWAKQRQRRLDNARDQAAAAARQRKRRARGAAAAEDADGGASSTFPTNGVGFDRVLVAEQLLADKECVETHQCLH